MKKIIFTFTISLIILLVIWTLIFGDSDMLSIVITVSVFIILIINYYYYEKSSMGSKEIALIATLSTFAAVSRVPFAVIPNVQPVTFMVALSGAVFGPYEGFLIGSTTAFISNIFLGQGPWTPWQMFAWGLVGFLSGVLGKRKKLSMEIFAVICFFYGFMFDFIMDLWHVLGFIRPLTPESVLAAYITGLPFDFMHATGNFIFVVIFYDKLYKVLYRFKKKFEITIISDNS